jgi:poly-gamma-glutamate capsule biosynthesis protein CapA/YwtB (metallophosphatase superfamily)
LRAASKDFPARRTNNACAMPRPLTLAATGDSLVTKRVAPSRDPAFLALANLIRSADVRFTNLEGTLHDYRGFPQAASGGTYVVGPPAIIEDLKALGFNLYAAANNHMVDWGEGGLLGTMETLDCAGVVYAGIGRHLAEARSPRYLETAAGRVALIATTSTFPPHAPAGEQRADCQGRPGINPLRFEETITVDSAALESLTELAGRLGVDAPRALSVRLGFARPDPEGISTVFGRRFKVGSPAGVHTSPHAGDLAGHLTWIKDARRQADWVLVSVHAHEMAGAEREQPAEFIPMFCRAAVDAGADAVLGHGPHLLRGLEIYRGRPIFYSLGNFIFQNEVLLRQPADFYERLGLPQTATPADLFDARGARGGFAADPLYWESAVPLCRWDGETLEEVRLYPVTLGYGLPRPRRGSPVLASAEHGRAIIERMARLSSECRIEWSPDGFGQVTWQR